jgi:hypothetical protein
MIQAGRSRVRFPMKLLDFFSLTNSSKSNITLGSTQPPTERSTRNLPGGKMRQALNTDNLTAIGEPIVLKM